ncbi:MAG: hypothetical protein VB124_05885, partial [Burkholderia sp.]
HLLEAKNRESSQETELLTGVLDWLLGINVNRSLARPIYATTPEWITARSTGRTISAPSSSSGGLRRATPSSLSRRPTASPSVSIGP